MAKLTLTFNLPDEEYGAKVAQNGSVNHSLLLDVLNYVRSLNKYEERDLVPKEEVVEKIRELLQDFEPIY